MVYAPRSRRGEEPVGQVDALQIPRFAGLRTFARLPRPEEAPVADVAVLGAPFDGATTFRPGARFGPAAVREASLLLRPYNDAQGVAPFAEAQVVDAGDAPCSPVDIATAHLTLEEAASALHGGGTRVLGLGGDHSVLLPFLRAAARQHGPLSLLQMDAHTDTWDSYFGARVTHGTIVRRAVDEGLVDAGASIQVGLRGSLYAPEDMAEHRALGFGTIMAAEIDGHGVDGVVREISRRLRPPVYITVDVDCLDPAFAPGTGTPEAGGLSSRELLAIIRGVGARHRPVAADVVEVAPQYDFAGVTAVAAANIAYELISLMAAASAAAENGSHA